MKMKEEVEFLGTTPEKLSRKFKLLEEEEMIRRKGRNVTLLDADGLEDL
ncbi:winged helix-turn-helix domain-containing protein [Bacillaceae bacterium Marseille-Q3522]|nr:winged helix-turn-helix domain-containing protein [Bacillaceae bacterium Marseille-Q3522]